MVDSTYPATTLAIHQRRVALAPEIHAAFEAFGKAVFANGALDEKTKQLIAVAVAHTTQCPYCIKGHTRLAHRAGATDEQIMEAVWVAAEMRAGGAYAHATIALSELARTAAVPHHDDEEPAAADELFSNLPGSDAEDLRRRTSRMIWEGGPV